MSADGTQVNVRLAPEEIALVDSLRRSSGVSRAAFLRQLLQERSREALDRSIAAAYDAAGPEDEDLGRASALAAGRALRDL